MSVLPPSDTGRSDQETRIYQRLEDFRPARRERSRLTAQLWQITQATLFGLSPHPLHGWRAFLLRLFGARLGRNVVIRPSARVYFPWNLQIGDRSWSGDEVRLYSLGKISIGSDTVVSQRSYVCAGSHDHTKPSLPTLTPSVLIGDQVWIATDVFVGPGVTIGDGAVIGARSSVFKDLEGGRLYRGSPASDCGPRSTEAAPGRAGR